MGGGQSQERVVGVEEGTGAGGERHIIVTEDFVKHISGKQQDGNTAKDLAPEDHGIMSDDDDMFTQSAKELLIGDDYKRGEVYLSEEDSLWKKKFYLELQKNSSLKSLSSESFDKAVNEIREKFSTKTSSDMMPVCEDCRDKVDNCYQRNGTKPLLCSNLVRKYVQCVEKHRKGLLQAPSQV